MMTISYVLFLSTSRSYACEICCLIRSSATYMDRLMQPRSSLLSFRLMFVFLTGFFISIYEMEFFPVPYLLVFMHLGLSSVPTNLASINKLV